MIVEFETLSYDDPYESAGSGHTCTSYHPVIITFDNEEEWKAEIAKRMDVTRPYYQKKEFKAYKMIPADIKMSVNVEVKEWQN